MPIYVKSLGAFSLLSLIIGLIAGPDGLIIEGVGLLLAVVACFLAIRIRFQSKYDLGALRTLIESGGPAPPDDLPDVAEDAGVVCPCCGTVYGAWMLICPNCKR